MQWKGDTWRVNIHKAKGSGSIRSKIDMLIVSSTMVASAHIRGPLELVHDFTVLNIVVIFCHIMIYDTIDLYAHEHR